MSCRGTRQRLSLYVGGDLGERAAERVRRHLSSCQDCRHEERRYQESRKVLFRLERQSRGPAPDLWPEVKRRIGKLAVPSRRPPRRAIAIAAACAAAGVAAILFATQRNQIVPDLRGGVREGPPVVAPGEGVNLSGSFADEPGKAEGPDLRPAGVVKEPIFASVDIPSPERFTWDEF